MAASADTETWECTVPGRIGMDVEGARPGTTRRIGVKGKGQRLRITTEQRGIVEEGIRKVENNPFANGKLRQVGGPRRKAPEGQDLGHQDLSDEDLAEFFQLGVEDFTDAMKELSEANVRRLATLMRDKGGTVLQQEILRAYIEEKWPITSGDTASYREMRTEPLR